MAEDSEMLILPVEEYLEAGTLKTATVEPEKQRRTSHAEHLTKESILVFQSMGQGSVIYLISH